MSSPPISNWQLVTHSPDETGRLGNLIGLHAVPASVIALIGNLGAGKTRLVQGIAAGLEVPPLGVNSPTFTLIQEYDGRLPVAHFDTYRLRTADEFAELGADDYLLGDWVSLVEWADRVESQLPTDRLTIRITHLGENDRELYMSAGGPHSQSLLDKLKSLWPQSS